MRKFIISGGLLAAMALCFCTNVSAQVPVKADAQNYDTAKENWVKNNPEAYEAMQSREQVVVKSNAQSVQDEAEAEAQKTAWIKQNPDLYKQQIDQLHRKNQSAAQPVVNTVKTSNQGPIPVQERNGEAYDQAKAKWVKENPAAYQQMQSSGNNQ